MIKLYYTNYIIRNNDIDFNNKSEEEARNFLFNTVNSLNDYSNDVVYNDHKKPDYIDERYHFNISHSKGLVLMGVSDTIIGVDCELIKANKNIDKLSTKIFNDNDFNYFINDDVTTLYSIWTIKEAYLKAVGIGLVSNIKEIFIDYEKCVVTLFGYPTLNFRSCIFNGYAITIVSKSDIEDDIVNLLIHLKKD